MKSINVVQRQISAGSLFLLLATAAVGQTHETPPTDWQIESPIQKALHDDHIFVGSSIMSSVDKGVVKLTGIVRSESEKEYASSDLANIPGVKTVLNNLEVHDNSFHPAPVPAKVAGPTGPKTLTLAVGTIVPVRLTEEINTKAAKDGDSFHGTTAGNVSVGGLIAIPAGAAVTGRVVEAKAAGRLSGAAELGIELVSIRLPIGGESQDVSLVTQELSNEGAGRGANTAAKTGGGAAFGAVIGALAGGGAGAGVGAASGGVIGLGTNALTHGKDIDLKPEQLLQFHTAAPFDVKVRLVDGQQVPQIPASPPSLQSRTAQ